ncbi:MAG: hypothetical protein ACC661_00780 [Verrucomicrobiales bacterium]
MKRSAWTLLLGSSLALCLAAWLLPSAKEGAVLGRLDYRQFIFALAATALCILISSIAATVKPFRRVVGFRLVAVYLAIAVALIGWEAVASLWPAEFFRDNPWYLSTGRALAEARDLPFTRPPHIRWKGLSRGDLAMQNGDFDPSAREIVFETDFEGFRNSRDIEKAEIIFLGDSFTEAGNVPEDETFVQQVGRSRGVAVRNLGRAGYAPPFELIVLQNYGLKNEPQVVVWQLFETNDLSESASYQQWMQSGRRPYRIVEPPETSARRQWSPTHRLFDALRRRKAWPLAGAFRDAKGNEREVRFLPVLPGAEHSPSVHPGWATMAAALTEGAEILKARDIELVVVLIPMKLRVMAEHVDFDPVVLTVEGTARSYQHRLPEGWDLVPEATMAFYVAELCRSLGVRFVDAAPRLKQQAAAGEMVFLPMDTHLSPQGHAVVADLIDGALSEAAKAPE